MFTKFIFFENPGFFEVSLRELENFTEQKMNDYKNSGAGGMDGMMKLFSGLMGGDEEGGAGDLAGLFGGGGEGGEQQHIEEMMKSLNLGGGQATPSKSIAGNSSGEPELNLDNLLKSF